MASRSPSVSDGRPMMKYILRLLIPQLWAVSTASSIRAFEIGFLRRARSSSDPVSGAMVTDRAPDWARGSSTPGTIAGIRREDKATLKPRLRLSWRI